MSYCDCRYHWGHLRRQRLPSEDQTLQYSSKGNVERNILYATHLPSHISRAGLHLSGHQFSLEPFNRMPKGRECPLSGSAPPLPPPRPATRTSLKKTYSDNKTNFLRAEIVRTANRQKKIEDSVAIKGLKWHLSLPFVPLSMECTNLW